MNSRMTPGVPAVRPTSASLLAVDGSVEDIRQRGDAGLVVGFIVLARRRTGQLEIAELVQHRDDRDGDQLRVVAWAVAVGLGTSHHLGDERRWNRTDCRPIPSEV